MHHYHQLISRHYNRGGASEASGATFTDHVAGARDVYARACMYHTRVKPSGQLLYAHAQMVLSQQSSKFIFTGVTKFWGPPKFRDPHPQNFNILGTPSLKS